MIASLFRDAFAWVVGLLESVGAVAGILLAGAVIGVAAFWILTRSLSKLAGPDAQADLSEDELEEASDQEAVPVRKDEDGPPSEH
jgi:hypothetical protein